MIDSRTKEIIRQGDSLFSKKAPLLSLWQSIADNFFPERADFTGPMALGEDLTSHLSTSYPIIARRDLGNSFGAMLRPRGQEWFSMRLERQEREDNAAKRWLEDKTAVQRRAMYDRKSGFVRSTSRADHDFAAFGQCALSVELGREGDRLLVRDWHLRDVAWAECHDGSVGPVYRNWSPEARVLAGEFRGRVAPQVVSLLAKDPYATVRCRHAVLPSAEYDSPSSKDDYEYIKPGVRRWKTPWISLYIDLDNSFIMEQVPSYGHIYVIPRWQTVSGSQYAYSPATVAALPDARLIQAMTLTLLEAGEKSANPPLVAVQEAIRSDVQIFAGGITWVDAEYDERLGEVLRPLTQDRSGLPVGMEMRNDAKQAIAEAFYLNKISLPIMAGDMTATEVSQRVQEYIRNALPLFEPMETEYNAALCEEVFGVCLRGGAFGSMDDMPPSLHGQDVEFSFVSPLQEAEGRKKGQTFMEAKALLAQAVELDPSSRFLIDAKTALRDSLSGIGTPANWMPDEEAVLSMQEQAQQQQQAQQLLATMQAGATTAKTVGEAGQALQGMTG